MWSIFDGMKHLLPVVQFCLLYVTFDLRISPYLQCGHDLIFLKLHLQSRVEVIHVGAPETRLV